MVVEGWLARAAAAAPTRTALQTPTGSCSYARLHAAARLAADELAARGVERGERVAIQLAPGLAFAQALHACLLLGAVAVPVDPRLSAAEREQILAGCTLLLAEPLPLSGREPLERGPTGHDLEAVAAVIHTSGTTAAPRAVELTYGNFLWSALGSAVALGVDPHERWLCALPVSHVGGLSILLRSAIYASTAVVHERFEVDRVLHALAEERVTLVSLVATTLDRLLAAGLRRPAALRAALTGGGPVPGELIERAHAAGVPVSLTYGLTESCSQVTTTPVAEIGAHRARAGPPLFCTRVRVAPDEEILVRGPTVAPGARAADGWLHTGDLGALRDGRLLVHGRKSDTIISGGENVAPAEVEAVLQAHPAVLEAAVVGRPDAEWGEAVTAWVLARPGSEIDFSELIEHCRRTLAPHKVPKGFMETDEPLPRTASGKLLRRELR
jgi:O-succinylbenzoic acid--CoA ligase